MSKALLMPRINSLKIQGRLYMVRNYNIFGFEIEKESLKILIEFALLVAVMMLAYNVGQYDSIQYHAMYEDCKNCYEYCEQHWNPFPEFNINLNKSPNETKGYG